MCVKMSKRSDFVIAISDSSKSRLLLLEVLTKRKIENKIPKKQQQIEQRLSRANLLERLAGEKFEFGSTRNETEMKFQRDHK